MILYALSDDGTVITCYLCQRTSHNMRDVRERYCGHCHRFLDDIESQGIAALYTAVALLRPDLYLEAQAEILEVLKRACSPAAPAAEGATLAGLRID